MSEDEMIDEVARRLVMPRSLWERCAALRRKREVLTGEPGLDADIAVVMISKGLDVVEAEIERAESGDFVETLDMATTLDLVHQGRERAQEVVIASALVDQSGGRAPWQSPELRHGSTSSRSARTARRSAAT